MKRKAALLLILLACCVVVGVCSANFQTANDRLSHYTTQSGGNRTEEGPIGLWQALWSGIFPPPEGSPELGKAVLEKFRGASRRAYSAISPPSFSRISRAARSSSSA